MENSTGNFTFKVGIHNLVIDNEKYSFDYKVWKDSVLIIDDFYETDHDYEDNYEKLENHLIDNGEASMIAMRAAMEQTFF